jgi:hypothetical protein
MVGRRDPLVERRQHLIEWYGLVDGMQDERGHALQRHVDEDAERAEPERDGRQKLGVLGVAHAEELAVRRDQRRTDDLGGETAETGTRSVGAGGDRPGDGLAIDVAEVLHRETVGRE